MEEEASGQLGNLATILEDAALFPFDEDIGHEFMEVVAGEEGDFDEKVESTEDFFNISEMLDDADMEENNADSSGPTHEISVITEENSAQGYLFVIFPSFW